MEQDNHNLVTTDDIREKIALRAYELYQDRGGQNGRDIDDWLQAETEVHSEAEQQHKLSGRKPASTSQSGEVPQRVSTITKANAPLSAMARGTSKRTRAD